VQPINVILQRSTPIHLTYLLHLPVSHLLNHRQWCHVANELKPYCEQKRIAEVWNSHVCRGLLRNFIRQMTASKQKRLKQETKKNKQNINRLTKLKLLRLTPVAMVTKICKFQHKNSYNSGCVRHITQIPAPVKGYSESAHLRVSDKFA